jgi:anti-sigma factor RsiW
MNCNDFQDRIIMYHADELQGADRQRLEEHLTFCAACAQFAAQMQQAVAAVNDVRLAVPPVDLWPAVRERIIVRRRLLPAVPPWVMAPVLGALLIGVLVKGDFHPVTQTKAGSGDLEIVNDLEFVVNYELWEDMETLEKAELTPSAQEV